MAYYKRVRHNGKVVLEHRLILAKKLGKSLDELGVVDHIDGDITNNHPDNLRECTISENNCNRRVNTSSTTGIKGLSWSKRDNRWRCSIIISGKQYQKNFKDKQEAIQWLSDKRKELHGEYARN